MPDRTHTVVTPPVQTGGTASVVSKERQHHVKIAIRPEDITGDDGQLDATKLVRLLQLIQDNAADSTRSSRSTPLYNTCLLKGVALVQNIAAQLAHTLGEPWHGAIIVRAQTGAAACSLNSDPTNGGRNPSTHAVVTPTATGVYDILLFGS